MKDSVDHKLNSIGKGRANGTFGELLQGVLPNQRKFMVTFPINLYSYVTFSPNKNTTEIITVPEHKIKSAYIAKTILKYFNVKIGGKLFIESELPEGKGLASSSADLVATAYAVANSINVNIEEKLIANFISGIEPSDGVMYLGVVSFYYQELELIEYIGNISSLVIIAIDEGYSIDTLEYNEKEKFYTPSCAFKYQDMLIRMTTAIKEKDLAVIGEISTESAIMNQKNNPKILLQEFIAICNEINGLGVCVAHSGSYIGILLNPNLENFFFQKYYCLEKLKKLNSNVKIFTSINFNLVKTSQNIPSIKESV